jgi:hypothetical protein
VPHFLLESGLASRVLLTLRQRGNRQSHRNKPSSYHKTGHFPGKGRHDRSSYLQS